MYAVYYRPDLEKVAEEVKAKYGMADFRCGGDFTHVFILGGDGTLLEALHQLPCILDSTVVHLGMGEVNFYRSAKFVTIEDAVTHIEGGRYRVVELSTLESINCVALNEVAVYRREPGRLLKFRVAIDEGGLEGRADGIIISTPHGTSGYVASTFGPIVDYRAPVLVISFVAPYTLFLRPLVTTADSVKVETREEAVLVCDGRGRAVGRNFVVRPGGKKLRLAIFDNFNFLERVAERFRSL
ncbi:MAG: NAD(+)/NADH kinase [Pyrobaculum sp.]